MSLLEEFYDEFGYAPKRSNGPLVNPGAKSINSLLDKVIRNIDNDGKTNFDFTNVPDMARCTLICNSYEDAPKLISQLKSVFPDLSGYISRCQNGYRGIHLNVSINGVTAEIQICTPKAYEYGQAAENIYAKWRKFSPKQQQEVINNEKQKLNNPNLSEEQKIEVKTNIARLEAQFKSDLKSMALEYGITNDLFAELHSNSGFKENESKIEAQLLSFELENKQKPKINSKLTRKFNIINGKDDEEDALRYINSIYPLAEFTQNTMIAKINQFVRSQQTNNAEFNTENLDNIKFMLDTYESCKASLMKESSNEQQEIINNHIRDYSIQKSKISVLFARYLMENKLSIGTDSIEKIFDYIEKSEEVTKLCQEGLSLDDLKRVAIQKITPVIQKIDKNELETAQKEFGFDKQKNIQTNNYVKTQSMEQDLSEPELQ